MGPLFLWCAAASVLVAGNCAGAESEATEQESPDWPETTGATRQQWLQLDDFDAHRTIGPHLGVHEPVYFIAGGKAPEAKFQLSFKYRLATLGSHARSDGSPGGTHTIQFAYTQRSVWDIGSRSSPFYDTSYMPELMYQWLAPVASSPAGSVSWLGVQSGFRHESNGQAGDASRSLNMLFVRSAFAIGAADSWHLLLVPQVHEYVGSLDQNPELRRYRGNFELRAGIAHADRESLLLTLVPGRNPRKGSRQLDLSIPIRASSIGLGTYLQIQYFDGYGESLRAYDERTSVLRAGIALVR